MPFNSDRTDVPLRNLARAAYPQIYGLIEGQFTEAIGRKKFIGTSYMFAENRGREPVIEAACRRPEQRILQFRVMGVANIAVEIPGASERPSIAEPSRLHIGAGEEPRSRRCEFFVSGNQGSVADPVPQRNSRARRPMLVVPARFQFRVLRPD